MGDLTKNFSRKEFKCRCGRRNCNAAPVDMKLVLKETKRIKEKTKP